MSTILRFISKFAKKKNRAAQRVLRIENLEGRAMMSATPLSMTAPEVSAANVATGTVQAPIAIESNEMHGLSIADKKTLQDIAAFASAAWQASNTAPSAVVQNGVLIIQGCKGNDWVNVVQNGNDVLLSHEVNGKVSNNEWSKRFSGVREIVFLAYGGDNTFHNNSRLPSRALGGDGKDYLKGSKSADDVLFGLAGNDELYGWEGSDRLYGGTGNDGLDAGSGADSEIRTTNLLKGGDGSDFLRGGRGHDQIFGNDGNDILFDDFGRGALQGGAGNDVLYIRDDSSPGGTKSTMQGGVGKDELIVKQGERAFFAWNKDKYADDAIHRPNQATEISRAEFNRLFQWNANQGAVSALAANAQGTHVLSAAEDDAANADGNRLESESQPQEDAAEAKRVQDLAVAKEARDQLTIQLTKAKAVLSGGKAELSNIRALVSAAESSMELKDTRLADLRSRRSELTDDLQAARQALREATPKQLAIKKAAVAEAEARVARVEQKLAEVRQERVQIRDRLTSLQDQLASAQSRKNEAAANVDRLRADLEAANRRVAQLEGQA